MAPEVVAAAVHFLELKPTINRLLAADLIIVTVLTGLRPTEWTTARLSDDTLTVVNAKYREDYRGNGPKRDLIMDLSQLSLRERLALERVLSRMPTIDWERDGDLVRRHIRRAMQHLAKSGLITARANRTRLYDARHQFAADAKGSLDFTAGEVAAAMGHVSAMTAYSHYGRARTGSRASVVKPSVASVEAVRPTSVATLAGKLNRTRVRQSGPSPMAATERPASPATPTQTSAPTTPIARNKPEP